MIDIGKSANFSSINLNSILFKIHRKLSKYLDIFFTCIFDPQAHKDTLMNIQNQHEFNILEVKEQMTLATHCGKHLISRSDGHYLVKLYHLKCYYVEIWINRKEGNVLYVRTFQHIKDLDPYLKQINISLIFNN